MKRIYGLMIALEAMLSVPTRMQFVASLRQGRLVENIKVALSNLALLNSAAFTGDYASFENYKRIAIIIALAPASGTDTAAITLKQSKTVDNSPATEKALSFTKVWKNSAPGTSDTLVETAVAGDSITTSAAAALELYVIEVMDTDLDINNDFDCVRVAVTDPGSVSTPAVVLMLGYEAKFAGPTPPSMITD